MENTTTAPVVMAMTLRRQRAAEIARTAQIKKRGDVFVVPSQTHRGSYVVAMEIGQGTPRWTCTCPDFEERGPAGIQCKHVLALEIVRTQQYPDGTTVTEKLRVTYPQNWVAYRAAQYTEKEQFMVLLRDLCRGVAQPPQERGRPRSEISDMLFAIGLKVYLRSAAARLKTDYKWCVERGLIRKAPHPNTMLEYFGSAQVTPILHSLVELSALPLRGIETKFAVDSTGIGTQTYAPGYRAMRYGEGKKRQHHWLKLHACIGVTTQVITAIHVDPGNGGDSPQFVPLLETTVRNGFGVREMTADAAYNSYANIQRVVDLGGTPYIPFPKGKGEGTEAPELYRQHHHFFQWHRQTFLAHYGARQNVESGFSALKRRFGDRVAAKTPEAQLNEVLTKAIAFNVVRVIQAATEFGIDPTFGAVERLIGEGAAVNTLYTPRGVP